MGKFDFNAENLKSDTPPSPARNKHGIGPCEVFGCPRAGHIHTNNWNCRYHFGRGGKSLAHITLTLKTHSREFDWYERMLNMTPVDFAMGDAKDAPYQLEVKEGESFKVYKKRVEQHIRNLLADKS